MAEFWVLNTKRVETGVSVAEYNNASFMLSYHKLKAESFALFACAVHGQSVYDSWKCFVALFWKIAGSAKTLYTEKPGRLPQLSNLLLYLNILHESHLQQASIFLLD